jgi:hypothetical protein
MIGSGFGAGLALVRSLAHELQDVPGTGAEHDEIDGDETQQRRGDGRGLERRGGGRGPEQAVDGEGLPPDFRCYPAGNHRDEARRRHGEREPVQRAPVVELAAEPCQEAEHPKSKHEEAQSHHDAE